MVEINRGRIFTLEEATKLLPVVAHITCESKRRVQVLMDKLELESVYHNRVSSELEDQINLIVDVWAEKLRKLGVRAQGLWIADFDSGDGYFCWKHPEERLLYWHGYDEGFSGRLPIERWKDRCRHTTVNLMRNKSILFTL